VNYVLDNDIYCIINIHHDTGHGSWPWLKADPENIELLEARLRTVWLQIAERFKEYDEKLLFESFNEILDTSDRWTNAGKGAYEAINRLNQVFVDTVRSSGGNNADRFLIVKTYAAGASEDMLDAFALPDDSIGDRLIVGVHSYGVRRFILRSESAPTANVYSDWDLVRDGKPVENILARLNGRFVEKGIPVIICEFGAQNKNNIEDRAKYAAHYIKTAKQYGMACFWWDDGGQYEKPESVKNFALLDRKNNGWLFPEIVEAMMKAIN